MIKAVIGLGNPGDKYVRTRHNVGFEVLDRLAQRAGQQFKRGWRLKARSCKMPGRSGSILLVKPQTFMNRSGETVRAVRRRHGLQPDEILVVVDDVDLPLGRVRLRKEGRSGGHNGLRSVEQGLGASTYPRLRLGVGLRPDGADLVEYVLDRFPADEWESVQRMVEQAADVVIAAADDGLDVAMNTYN